MKSINKKIIVTILVIIEIMLINITYKSYSNRIINEKEIENKRVAIKVDNGSKEYKDSETLPGRGYVLNTELTECLDIEGNKIENIKLDSNGENITITGRYTSYCTIYYYLPENREYDYTGDYQVFIAPKTGNYKIELWGASGGENISVKTGTAGRGAYTKGLIYLNQNDKLYIYIGENIQILDASLSIIPFNGGGPGEATGGGATDVRLDISSSGNWDDFNSLKSRIMVAAGGGGGAYIGPELDYTKTYQRGDGGSLTGFDARFYASYHDVFSYDYSGHGATQTNGGEPGTVFSGYVDLEKTPEMTGKFGKGGYSIDIRYNHYSSSGGGGGYYGGGHGNHPGSSWSAGGGGSSYISGHEGCVAIKEESTEDEVQPKDECNVNSPDLECSKHYSGKYFTDTLMLAGNEEMPTHSGDGNMTGNEGNGYAKITFVN